MTRSALILAGLGLLACAGVRPAFADTVKLLPGHAANGPRRGMTMAEVERHFGAPSSKLPPAGGDAPRHPVINRWVYPDFTVYFERDRVIDSVTSHPAPSAAES
jgi:hypothetical protein